MKKVATGSREWIAARYKIDIKIRVHIEPGKGSAIVYHAEVPVEPLDPRTEGTVKLTRKAFSAHGAFLEIIAAVRDHLTRTGRLSATDRLLLDDEDEERDRVAAHHAYEALQTIPAGSLRLTADRLFGRS